MKTTIKFKGTPAKFADVYWRTTEELSWTGLVSLFTMFTEPPHMKLLDRLISGKRPGLSEETTTVALWLNTVDEDLPRSDDLDITLYILAEESQYGSLVTLEYADEAWPYLKETWELIRNEFIRKGWVDEEPSTTLTVSAQNKPISNIRDEVPTTEDGRRYFPRYNPTTARQIADALPKAYATYEQNGGSWGSSVIARESGFTISTVSNYLKAFRGENRTHIRGVPLPRAAPKIRRNKS